jgi:hypothetical protein
MGTEPALVGAMTLQELLVVIAISALLWDWSCRLSTRCGRRGEDSRGELFCMNSLACNPPPIYIG